MLREIVWMVLAVVLIGGLTKPTVTLGLKLADMLQASMPYTNVDYAVGGPIEEIGWKVADLDDNATAF